MAIPEGKVRIVSVVEVETAEKIEQYAQAMGLSESRFIRNLVTCGLEDDEWLFRAMTGHYGRLVKQAIVKLRGQVKPEQASDLEPGYGVDKEQLEKVRRKESPRERKR